MSQPAGAAAHQQPDELLLDLPPALVTGEAVELELRPASVLTRGLALALDAVVQLAVLVGGLFLYVIATDGADEATLAASALALSVLALVVLPFTWETLSRGRSPGKAAAGLRVVRDDGGPVRARQALVRVLATVGEVWLTGGSVAAIACLASARGKRVGDHLAGTVVVRERVPRSQLAPLEAPPELAAWVRSADVGVLPDQLAVAARTALSRAASLHPASREQLLGSLASEVAQHVSPPPPAGTPPERLLAAVLAERRDRDRVRARAARERRDALHERSRRLTGL
ncbi:RDD family protein [Quadrisphaera sp. INWT6]|uniref:RDD family protein n=1 Tax=Quadrisphaera sp. INWT6 TaxID=2596917 RepID=UPI0018924138|nr:RDD family protein [Quadrisphaera sp. INWT6]MBF5081427.1 RDD family protein [Quadrisphaera sp. INWT6]